MKLRNVMICLNCDEVFEQETVHFLDQKVRIEYCPLCASEVIARLCRWLPTMRSIEPRAESKDCNCMYNGETPPYQCGLSEENKCKTKAESGEQRAESSEFLALS